MRAVMACPAEAPPSLVLRHYASLDRASHEMLEAARQGDWDRVCRLEGACAVVIAGLRQLGGAAALMPSEQDERIRILKRIIERDAQIRALCGPAAEDAGIAFGRPIGAQLH